MKSGHSGSDNLFSRLFSYVPCHGEKQKREPLEDFCTEALAYLLASSRRFRQEFAARVLRMSARVLEGAKVETQYYAGLRQGQDRVGDSRIDLVLRPTQAADPIIGIESKIGAKLGPKQLRKYGEALTKEGGVSRPAPRLFFLVPRYYRQETQKAVRHERVAALIHWEDVQATLARFAAQQHSTGGTEIELAGQFASFLASNGLKRLEMNMNPCRVSNISEAAKMIDEWSDCLDKLRIVLPVKGRGKHRDWDRAEGEDGSSFYGIYGNGWTPYAGFEITPAGRVFCYYELKVPGAFPQRFSTELQKRIRGALLRSECVPGDGVWIKLREEYPRSKANLANVVVGKFQAMQKSAADVEKQLVRWLRNNKRGR